MNAAAVQISELGNTRRIDAECYQPAFLSNYEFLTHRSQHPVVMLGSLLNSISGGATPLGADYPEEGIPFLRVQNIMPGYLDTDDLAYIPEHIHKNELKRSQLQPRDGLLTITGVSYGKAAYVPENFGEANINQHSVRMALKPGVLPEYLAMFLNCRFGRLQTDRKITGGTRPALDYDEIRSLLIPIPPLREQESLRLILQQAEQQRSQARDLYAQAQALLAAELGLDKLELPNEHVSFRRLSDVREIERIDAEYFHPEKAFVQAQLAKLPSQSVGKHFDSVRDIYNPPTKDTGKSILNFDLTDALQYFIDDSGPVVPENEIGSIKKRLKRNDVLVSRLRSYLKEIALAAIPDDIECVGSSEFFVMRSRSVVHPELLVVYLRSEPVQLILKWSQDGANHPRFQEAELLDIKLPDRVIKVQDDIRKLFRAGIGARRESKRLLAEAKAEVERMIEGR